MAAITIDFRQLPEVYIHLNDFFFNPYTGAMMVDSVPVAHRTATRGGYQIMHELKIQLSIPIKMCKQS